MEADLWLKCRKSRSLGSSQVLQVRCSGSRYHMQVKTKRQEHDYAGSTNGKRPSHKYRASLQGKGWLICCIHRRRVMRSEAAKRYETTQNAMARPPDFLDVDRMKVEMIGKEDEIKKLLHYANKWGNNSFKILGLTSIDAKGESLLSNLTPRQRQMLLTAYALGYYDVPRRISSDDLSRHLDVDKSTIVEHLRKAERKLIGGIIAG
jgi:predicted DNA binding protein